MLAVAYRVVPERPSYTIADEAAFGLGVRFTGPDPTDRIWDALPTLTEQIATGQLKLPIWKTYPLANAAKAQDQQRPA